MEIPANIGALSALVTDFGLRLIVAVVIFFVGRWAAQMFTKLAKRLMARADVEDTLQQFLGNLLYALLLTFVIIATISQLGVQTTSLIAVLGAAGLAVGLALQGSLSNFAAGVLLVAFRPYRVVDYIDGGGGSDEIDGRAGNDTLVIFDDRSKTKPNRHRRSLEFGTDCFANGFFQF